MRLQSRSLFGFLCATWFGVGCQSDSTVDISTSGQAIIGGELSEVGEYPNVVALVVDQGARGLCTATLVAPDWVLTAAHCIDPGTLRYQSQEQVTADTVIVFDTVDLGVGNAQTQVIPAEATFPHPDFDEPGDVDIGLIKLSRPVTDRVPSGINFETTNAPGGVGLELVGYGLTNPNDQGSSGRQFNLEKDSVSCSRFGIMDENLLCLSSGACSGDSGGPSYINVGGQRVVAGVGSFADQNCSALAAYMRTDAPASVQFIDEIAPDLLCGSNGSCNESCGTNELPVDPDCAVCKVNAECPDPATQICDLGFCVAAPGQPGAIGSACGNGLDACLSGTCAENEGEGICTRTCEPGSSCPSGFTCTATAGDQSVCWPGDDGGCRTSGSNGGLRLVFVFAALAWVMRRRKKFS